MERTFDNVEKTDRFTLQTEEGYVGNFQKGDILISIDDLLEYEGEFVILTAPEPKDKIRYVQCCTHGDIIEVELGIQEERTRLVFKYCDEEELKKIFLDFYDGKFKPDMSEYEPVQFV